MSQKDKALTEKEVYILMHREYLTCQAFISQDQLLSFNLTFVSLKKKKLVALDPALFWKWSWTDIYILMHKKYLTCQVFISQEQLLRFSLSFLPSKKKTKNWWLWALLSSGGDLGMVTVKVEGVTTSTENWDHFFCRKQCFRLCKEVETYSPSRTIM